MPEDETHRPTEDLGQPVDSLGSLEVAASTDFFAKIRRKVWRHETVTEFVIFSLETPGPIFVELAALLVASLRATGSKGGTRS